MYSLPSTSRTCAPLALLTKNGCPPTARNARTGEFTPPGIYFSASPKSSSDFFLEIMCEHLRVELSLYRFRHRDHRFVPVPLRNWNPAAHSKCLAGYLQPRRSLASLILIQINEANYLSHCLL